MFPLVARRTIMFGEMVQMQNQELEVRLDQNPGKAEP